MISYIGIKDKMKLPKFWDLVYYMWDKELSISYVKVGEEIWDCKGISVSWDKWIDNPKWSGSYKTVEHIDIDIYNVLDKEIESRVSKNIYHLINKNNNNYIVCIDISDNAVTMDRRAFLRATYMIAKKCSGIIYDEERNKLLSYEEFYNINKFIIEKTFDKSVEGENRNNNLRTL